MTKRLHQSVALAGMLGLVALLAGGLRLHGAVVTDELDQEPIQYRTADADNAIAKLDKRLASGKTRLAFDEERGYLSAVLKALDIPESSQMLVFSKTSLQRQRISPRTPRALYFNDDIFIGYCQGGAVLEIATVDPKLGTAFYTLEQDGQEKPRFTRQTDACLQCHASSQTQGNPGHLVRSVFPDASGLPMLSSGSYRIDHTSPISRRWGGWYVTGTHGKETHLGNLIISGRRVPEPVDNSAGMNLTDLGKRIDLSPYLTKHSDIIALMVMEHQAEGHNQITRAGFETRKALYQEATLNRELKEAADHRWESTTRRIRSVTESLVKYLLFSREAELTAKIQGTSGFAEEFVRRGPRDARGRSLRDFDLERRLFKYPCSYLIYSPSFDALPAVTKDAVFRRIWEVLHNIDSSADFGHLTAADRQAIQEILVATKPDLPGYWREKTP